MARVPTGRDGTVIIRVGIRVVGIRVGSGVRVQIPARGPVRGPVRAALERGVALDATQRLTP